MESRKLTTYQKNKIETKRNQALQLRQSRVSTKSQQKCEEGTKNAAPRRSNRTRAIKDSSSSSSWASVEVVSESGSKTSIGQVSYDGAPKRVVDSGGGFYVEDESEDGRESGGKKHNTIDAFDETIVITQGQDQPECKDCGSRFQVSFLMTSFSEPVCDTCRSGEGNELITRTEAKAEFLLKDIDLDGCAAYLERTAKPPLRYITRKNPHNPRWGVMRLYLRSQIEARALQVWGAESKLEDEHDSRLERRETAKVKRFNEQIKQLRMQVRGSLFQKDLAVHSHEFGAEEQCDEDDDTMFARQCLTCPHVWKYERM